MQPPIVETIAAGLYLLRQPKRSDQFHHELEQEQAAADAEIAFVLTDLHSSISTTSLAVEGLVNHVCGGKVFTFLPAKFSGIPSLYRALEDNTRYYSHSVSGFQRKFFFLLNRVSRESLANLPRQGTARLPQNPAPQELQQQNPSNPFLTLVDSFAPSASHSIILIPPSQGKGLVGEEPSWGIVVDGKFLHLQVGVKYDRSRLVYLLQDLFSESVCGWLHICVEIQPGRLAQSSLSKRRAREEQAKEYERRAHLQSPGPRSLSPSQAAPSATDRPGDNRTGERKEQRRTSPERTSGQCSFSIGSSSLLSPASLRTSPATAGNNRISPNQAALEKVQMQLFAGTCALCQGRNLTLYKEEGCLHPPSYCELCLQKWINDQLTRTDLPISIKCPDPGCSVALSVTRTIQKYAKKEDFLALHKRLERHVEKTSEGDLSPCCSNSSCGSPLSPREARQADELLTCSVCSTVTCARCGSAFHPGIPCDRTSPTQTGGVWEEAAQKKAHANHCEAAEVSPHDESCFQSLGNDVPGEAKEGPTSTKGGLSEAAVDQRVTLELPQCRRRTGDIPSEGASDAGLNNPHSPRTVATSGLPTERCPEAPDEAESNLNNEREGEQSRAVEAAAGAAERDLSTGFMSDFVAGQLASGLPPPTVANYERDGSCDDRRDLSSGFVSEFVAGKLEAGSPPSGSIQYTVEHPERFTGETSGKNADEEKRETSREHAAGKLSATSKNHNSKTRTLSGGSSGILPISKDPFQILCSNAACQFQFQAVGLVSNLQLICPECGFATCLRCRAAFHEGTENCVEAERTRKLLQFAHIGKWAILAKQAVFAGRSLLGINASVDFDELRSIALAEHTTCEGDSEKQNDARMLLKSRIDAARPFYVLAKGWLEAIDLHRPAFDGHAMPEPSEISPVLTTAPCSPPESSALDDVLDGLRDADVEDLQALVDALHDFANSGSFFKMTDQEQEKLIEDYRRNLSDLVRGVKKFVKTEQATLDELEVGGLNLREGVPIQEVYRYGVD